MRVWITGVGIVSPLARGAAETMKRLCAGERAFAELSLFSAAGHRASLAAECAGITPDLVAPTDAEIYSRTDALAVLAVREALSAAGIHPTERPVDLVVGGTTAGMFETEETLARLSREPEAVTPLRQMLAHPLSSTADHVRALVGPFRRARSVCSACSSGSNAILLGAAWIASGRADAVVAGGAEGLCRLTFAGFGALSALDPSPCRPFDRRRGGLNLGEGAGFVVLESEESARARGRVPLAELSGFAVGAEAHHITNPEATGRSAARVMRSALARAGIAPADVDYVNAHGTATPLNDSMETAALAACFGERAAEALRVSTVKGQIGHTLGAAGGIEAAVTALAIAQQVLPPTVGLEEVDPACRLGHVLRAERAKVRAAISNSFGFGGTDTVLVLTEPEAFPPPTSGGRRPVVVTAAASVGPLGVQGTRGGSAYLEPGPAPEPGPLAFQVGDHLDLARARRLDRAGRLAALVVSRAYAEGGLSPESAAEPGEIAGARLGAVVGAAFGSVDGSTAYMRRVEEKGARFASPADFPNLVPSSPAGHASIYLGLRGPVLATSDLGATPESAIATAAELLEIGIGEAIAAGSVEEVSPMVERCLGPVCSEIEAGGATVRSEGASVLLLESAEHAARRGAKVAASLAFHAAWRGPGGGALALAPPPRGRVLVVLGRDEPRLRETLEGSPWSEAPVAAVAPRAGGHEGAGGFAAVSAVSAIAAGALDAALVVGGAPDRGYALLFVRPEAPGEAEGASRPREGGASRSAPP